MSSPSLYLGAVTRLPNRDGYNHSNFNWFSFVEGGPHLRRITSYPFLIISSFVYRFSMTIYSNTFWDVKQQEKYHKRWEKAEKTTEQLAFYNLLMRGFDLHHLLTKISRTLQSSVSEGEKTLEMTNFYSPDFHTINRYSNTKSWQPVHPDGGITLSPVHINKKEHDYPNSSKTGSQTPPGLFPSGDSKRLAQHWEYVATDRSRWESDREVAKFSLGYQANSTMGCSGLPLEKCGTARWVEKSFCMQSVIFCTAGDIRKSET